MTGTETITSNNSRIIIDKVTRWYGQVIGVNDISFKVGPGVTGLLGPNGAGKSTLMKLITGHIQPNQGSVKVDGVDPFFDHTIKRRMGYAPEMEALPDQDTGNAFLKKRALLRGYTLKEAGRLAESAMVKAGLENITKKIGAYSKGMRQRLKLAQASFYGPDIIILDEPLTGLDPVGRRQVLDQIRDLGEEGRTLLVSSHVLHEVELMTDQVVLITKGKILAEGSIEHIRSLIDSHPHSVDIETSNPRKLALLLLEKEVIKSADIEEDKNSVRIKTRFPDRFYETLGELVISKEVDVMRFHSPDNNLQAVFDYLVK